MRRLLLAILAVLAGALFAAGSAEARVHSSSPSISPDAPFSAVSYDDYESCQP